MSMTQTSQQRAVMFADVSGSSSLYKLLGNTGAKARIDATLTAMLVETEAHQGHLVKTIGDEIMVTFADAEQAVLCAQNLQRQAGICSEFLPVRIGLAWGDTLIEQADVFGDTVNNAAWLTRIARAGQILLNDKMHRHLSPARRRECHEFDRIVLKGDDQHSVIYRLRWESSTQSHHATAVLRIDDVSSGEDVISITLRYGKLQHCILPQQTPFILGRDRNRTNLRITHHLASREHCEVVFRRGKFVLVDHSTNGTYVSVPNQAEIYLRREELPLMGAGKISFGQPIDQSDEEVVSFNTSRLDLDLELSASSATSLLK